MKEEESAAESELFFVTRLQTVFVVNRSPLISLNRVEKNTASAADRFSLARFSRLACQINLSSSSLNYLSPIQTSQKACLIISNQPVTSNKQTYDSPPSASHQPQQ
jgi:hypothetical protein